MTDASLGQRILLQVISTGVIMYISMMYVPYIVVPKVCMDMLIDFLKCLIFPWRQ
jgi:hypothetical protein